LPGIGVGRVPRTNLLLIDKDIIMGPEIGAYLQLVHIVLRAYQLEAVLVQWCYSGKEMEREMEALEHRLPFVDYARDEKKLRQHVEQLEKEYDAREKVIERIMEYGTGVENEKALRMYSIPVLTKWEAALEKSYRVKAKQ
jgi:hypothetical protein